MLHPQRLKSKASRDFNINRVLWWQFKNKSLPFQSWDIATMIMNKFHHWQEGWQRLHCILHCESSFLIIQKICLVALWHKIRRKRWSCAVRDCMKIMCAGRGTKYYVSLFKCFLHDIFIWMIDYLKKRLLNKENLSQLMIWIFDFQGAALHCTIDSDLLVSSGVQIHCHCGWAAACWQLHVTKKLKACPWTHPQVPAVETSLQVTVIGRHICLQPRIHLRRETGEWKSA